MLVRIIKPLPLRFEGFDVSRFETDRSYDIQSPLCDVIIADGFGVPDDEPPRDRTGALKALAGVILLGESKPAPALKPSGSSGMSPGRPKRKRS
jgi:hypothetical protein